MTVKPWVILVLGVETCVMFYQISLCLGDNMTTREYILHEIDLFVDISTLSVALLVSLAFSNKRTR